MKIIERLFFLASGGTTEYRHRAGKENTKATDLQNLLDGVAERATKRVADRIASSGKPEESSVLKEFDKKFN